jgi:hypothetical protein
LYAGYWARVRIYENGNPIGQVQYSHLTSQRPIGSINPRGGTVGTIGSFRNGSSCWKNAVHVHMELGNYTGPYAACMHVYGTYYGLVPGSYMGYIGQYGKPPLSGNRCPNGI